MSFFTSFCDLPQNEQRNVSSARLTISAGGLLQNFQSDERPRFLSTALVTYFGATAEEFNISGPVII